MSGSVNAEMLSALHNDGRLKVGISSGVRGHEIQVHVNSAAKEIATGTSGPKPVRLSTRELQVLRLIVKGLHNRQIAARIHRSIKTIEKHRQNLHTKLSTHEVAGLTRQAMVLGLMGKTQGVARRLAKGAKQLTPRELEILKLVAQGSGNKWIASELHRSIKTVDHHRENIMKKLGIHQVAGLTSYALSLGLL
jgi:DNA-binding NarL/FixJ family response regulator